MKWFRRRAHTVHHHYTFPFVMRRAESDDDLRVVSELMGLIDERRPGRDSRDAGGSPPADRVGDGG
jgi:hypothetical protein